MPCPPARRPSWRLALLPGSERGVPATKLGSGPARRAHRDRISSDALMVSTRSRPRASSRASAWARTRPAHPIHAQSPSGSRKPRTADVAEHPAVLAAISPRAARRRVVPSRAMPARAAPARSALPLRVGVIRSSRREMAGGRGDDVGSLDVPQLTADPGSEPGCCSFVPMADAEHTGCLARPPETRASRTASFRLRVLGHASRSTMMCAGGVAAAPSRRWIGCSPRPAPRPPGAQCSARTVGASRAAACSRVDVAFEETAARPRGVSRSASSTSPRAGDQRVVPPVPVASSQLEPVTDRPPGVVSRHIGVCGPEPSMPAVRTAARSAVVASGEMSRCRRTRSR